MHLNIPTWITVFRAITIPFFVLFFYLPYSFGPLFSALIFFIASLTDWFDGFLARRWDQSTVFGSFFDPIIDKLLVVTALVLIVELFHTWWITLPVVSMIIREIVVSALREWVARIFRGANNILVSKTSKIKTTIQMFALGLLLWHPGSFLTIVGIIMLYLAFILTIWSILKYFHVVYNNFTKDNFRNY